MYGTVERQGSNRSTLKDEWVASAARVPPSSKGFVQGLLGDPESMVKMFFSCGHVLNDLCAAAWFTYMIIFFERVAGLSAYAAGALVLLGQVVDAVTTPVVGVLCDKSAESVEPGMRGGGVASRLPWHLWGCVLVAVSFPFLFIEDVQYVLGTSQWAVSLWYAWWVSLFQIGWATVQIAHLAIIPDLSAGCPQRRTSLNAVRYAATIIATVAVYVAAWVLLSDFNGGKHTGSDLSRANHVQFRVLAISIVAGGSVVSIVTFHRGMRDSIKEADYLDEQLSSRKPGATAGETAKVWLKSAKFWAVAIHYMATRLVTNITQSYLALYLLVTLGMPKTAIATAPLLLYATSLIGAWVSGRLHRLLGYEWSYVVSLIFTAGSAWGLYVVYADQVLLLYTWVGLFGVASAVLMISCLSMVAELIGDLPGSAFVYGSFSFADKMSSGAVIMVIQSLGAHADLAWYYRWVVGAFPAAVSVVALAAVGLCMCVKTPTLRDFPKSDSGAGSKV
eukprot:Hpha_TRINITY_DN230_c0_g1::TRINITY_DN230_c0_g1_i1::g.83709::m.83709